jgi:hypothetical protein
VRQVRHDANDEIKKLIAFLKWVDAIDTNEWPPKPITVIKVTGTPLEETAQVLKGKAIYNQNRYRRYSLCLTFANR